MNTASTATTSSYFGAARVEPRAGDPTAVSHGPSHRLARTARLDPRGGPLSRAAALRQLAALDDAGRDADFARIAGDAFGRRSGRALERRLEAIERLEAAGEFTCPLYRALCAEVAAHAAQPGLLLLHAPAWEFFSGGVERTLASARALGPDRVARVPWTDQAGPSLLHQALDHAPSVGLFLTRELLTSPERVRTILSSLSRAEASADGPQLPPRLQVVLFDDLPDLRRLKRAAWGPAFADLAHELGDPAVCRIAQALGGVPVIAAAGSPPGEVARSFLGALQS